MTYVFRPTTELPWMNGWYRCDYDTNRKYGYWSSENNSASGGVCQNYGS